MISKKILIVDDETDIVDTLKFSLEHEGYFCLTAFNGLEAIEKTHNEFPDLIILDIRLPKKNGYQVCRLLRFDKNFQHIPIIMLTAKAQEVDKMIGQETGANDYLTKPFDMDLLIKKIKEYI